ncbi:MAG: T9SS type A sorting domain-containing protein [Bacteroidia bacterium]
MGNILYHHFPRFDSYKLVSKPFLIDSKFYDFVGSYYSVLDTAGNLLNKYVFYNDSIMNHSNTGFSESVFEHHTCYASGAITFFDTIYHGYPLIIKADSALNVQWAHYITSLENVAFFDKTCLGVDGSIYSLIKYDSVYISTDSTAYGIAKFDTLSGSLQWAKKYLKSPYIIKDIIPFDSTSILMYGMNDEHFVGGTNPYWDDSLFVMRIDTGGNVIGFRKYRQGTTGLLFVSQIINASDGGFILTGGFAEDTIANGKILMIKFDNQLNIQWARKHFASDGYAYSNSVIQTNDGGYLVCGGATLGPGPNDVYAYIIKTDSLGSAGCEEDTLAGITYTTMNVTPVDLNYTTDTISIYTAPVAIGDTMMGSFTEYDACVFLGVPEFSIQQNNGLLIYPNPATTIINIQLKPNTTATQIDVYDMQGRLVLQSNDVNSYPLQLNVAALVKGMYVVRVSCGESSFMGRVVVE